MDLLKKNIHMDVLKCQASGQITLEDDVNLSDVRPDIEKIILEDGTGEIEEIKTSKDHVSVKGKLNVKVLYIADDKDNVIAKTEGSIPFEEDVFMEGVEPNQHVEASLMVEDLSIGLINSRKISVRAIVTIRTWLQELTDEEACVDIACEEPIEYRKKKLNFTQIAVCKKDIYRLRQELDLPSDMPNVFQSIWEDIRISNLDFKTLDGKIELSGELQVFVLYEGEGEEHPIRFFEGSVPFSDTIDEKSCTELMIADIEHHIGNLEIEIKPDFDGEERVILVEAVLDLDIRLYEEEQMDILADLYGATKEATAVIREGTMRQLLFRNNAKTKVEGKLKLRGEQKNIMQLLYANAVPIVEEEQVLEDGILVNGHFVVKCLYVTNDDMVPYNSVTGKIPFEYMMDAKGLKKEHQFKTRVNVEQINVTMSDSEAVDVKIIMRMQAIAFTNLSEEFITDVTIEDLDMKKLKDLPQMVIYVAKEGDSLWKIGKKYYVPVADLKEVNELTNDECKAGQKIIVVR